MQRAPRTVVLLIFLVSLSAFARDPKSNNKLISAAEEGNLQLVKEFLAKGADVNAKDNQGYTALMWAAYNGHIDVIKELLLSDADVNGQDYKGYTALMWADEQGYTDIVQLLKKAGWSTYSDPKGFFVKKPTGWNVSNDPQTGRIVIQGTQGERVVIWPMFIEQQRLDGRGAAVVIQQLAHKVDPQLPWGTAEVSGNFVCVVARLPQRIGATIMTWEPVQNGTSICMYSLAAPPDIYHGSVDTFSTILGSFQIVKEQVGNGPSGSMAAVATAAAASFVNWSDPHEGAFSVSVPQGWKVTGGAYRLSATDVRMSVILVSSDGRVRVAVGDSNVGTFTQPNQMYYKVGLKEGSMTRLGDGTPLQIRMLISGQQFAREYVEGFVRKICPDLRISSNNMRSDLTGVFLQQASSEGIINSKLSAGDASFVGSLNGNEVRGRYVVATCLPFPDKGQLWYVYRLYGYLAPPERQQEADMICKHVVDSWAVNPQWRMKEKQIAAAAVQADNIRSQQIRQRALQAIAEDQRETSDMISKSYWQRQNVYNEISRKRENAILGTVDVVDPGSHSQYKITYNSDYHWMDNQGNIAGTQTHTSPGVGWRKMIDLP
ncbi:MAG: ankyrin repeat domain-containing protein [Deltaproteobacteria bacterium]|nr:ankyrin repeat domain-containing protein [Deltaproteobacteria bacterium]